MPTSPSPRIAGLLLSGGASSRFGAPKALALLAGATLSQIALSRLSTVCALSAIAGPPDPGHTGGIHLPDSADLPRGPLTGVLAGLEWAKEQQAKWLAVSPCDMPLLPPDIHRALLETATNANAKLAIISCPDGLHPLCSLWSTSLAATVRDQLTSAHPPIWRYALDLGAARLELSDPNHALNINVPTDLERAARLQDYHWWACDSGPAD
jgi:molybdopterin-guanine dinucleotide biosynthesis protein A